jgi:hypothetical protein
MTIEYSANSSQFDNRAKRFITINTNLLATSIRNKAGLISAKGSIYKILVLKQSHGTKNVHVRWSWHKNPSFNFNKRIIFIKHSSFQLGSVKAAIYNFGKGDIVEM